MSNVIEYPWPANLLHDLFDFDAQRMKSAPNDLIGSVEYVLRTALSDDEQMLIRERYEEQMTLGMVAGHHGMSIKQLRSQIRRIFKKLLDPKYSIYLQIGIKNCAYNREAYENVYGFFGGYAAGYEGHKRELLFAQEIWGEGDGIQETEDDRNPPSWKQYLLCAEIEEMDPEEDLTARLKKAGIHIFGQLVYATDERLLCIDGIDAEMIKSIHEMCKMFVPRKLREYGNIEVDRQFYMRHT